MSARRSARGKDGWRLATRRQGLGPKASGHRRHSRCNHLSQWCGVTVVFDLTQSLRELEQIKGEARSKAKATPLTLRLPD